MAEAVVLPMFSAGAATAALEFTWASLKLMWAYVDAMRELLAAGADPVLVVGGAGVIEDALRSLGVGGQIGVAATLGALAVWARKFVAVGKRLRNGIAYVAVFAVLLSLLLIAGWARLDLGAIQAGVDASLRFAAARLSGVDLGSLLDSLRGVLS